MELVAGYGAAQLKMIPPQFCLPFQLSATRSFCRPENKVAFFIACSESRSVLVYHSSVPASTTTYQTTLRAAIIKLKCDVIPQVGDLSRRRDRRMYTFARDRRVTQGAE